MSNFLISWPDPSILCVDNVFSERKCNQIISKLDQLNMWEHSMIEGSRVVSKIRNSFQFYISNCPDEYIKSVDHLIYTCLNNILIGHYCKKFTTLNISNGEGFYALKYGVGDYYDYHSDQVMHFPRTVSSILYLNESFKGGETHFKHQDLKISPKSGRLIVFPSYYNYEHSSLEVTEGIKYNISTFIR